MGWFWIKGKMLLMNDAERHEVFDFIIIIHQVNELWMAVNALLSIIHENFS